MLQWILYQMSPLQFGFSSNHPPAKKKQKKWRKKESKSSIWQRENKQKMARLLRWRLIYQWWWEVRNVLLHVSQPRHGRAALVIIIHSWIPNFKVGRNCKVHSVWILHQDCAGKEGLSQTDGARLVKLLNVTADREDGSPFLSSACPCYEGKTLLGLLLGLMNSACPCYEGKTLLGLLLGWMKSACPCYEGKTLLGLLLGLMKTNPMYFH